MPTRTKLPFRNVHSDRTLQEVQSAVRQIAADSNSRWQYVTTEEYANADFWGNTISGTASTSYVDSLERLFLKTSLRPGDQLIVHGRAFVGTDAGVGGDWQIVVYEDVHGRKKATTKPGTFYHVSSVGFDKFAFGCVHTVSVPGQAEIALQYRVASGVGNVAVFARGQFFVQIWRP